jgi:hypothetical protein
MKIIFSKISFIMGSRASDNSILTTHTDQRDDHMYGIIKFWEDEKTSSREGIFIHIIN